MVGGAPNHDVAGTAAAAILFRETIYICEMCGELIKNRNIQYAPFLFQYHTESARAVASSGWGHGWPSVTPLKTIQAKPG
jgi:hypothetical protein